MVARPELNRRPDARADSVEDLVAKALRGEIRVPRFQRGLKWKAKDVVDLFDSIYRGFPIGSLLLRQGPAPTATLQLGPLPIFGNESGSAWWVVDGQQRITALVAGLARQPPYPSTPNDPYVVYVDPVEQSFHAPPSDGDIPSTWVPLPLLLDASVLQEWMFGWAHGRDADLRRVVFEIGKRIREYRVPTYVIDTDDEEVLRTIFHRVNNTGRPLNWTEVHDALYGHRGIAPSSLSELADELEAVGMGRPEERSQLLPCLLAFKGADVTRSLGEYLREDPKFLDGVVAASLPTIREVLGFLRTRAEIPHLRLLPYSTPLVVLTRFFRQHPQPIDRSLTLLTRWVWRFLLAGDHDDRVLKRRGVSSITSDEEGAVQSLIELVPKLSPAIELPEQFDARSAHSRLVLLAMASLRPLSLADGERLDIAELIKVRDVEAFRALFPPRGDFARSPANRVLMPGNGSAIAEVRGFISVHGFVHPFLRSHAITPDVAEAIGNRDDERALQLRAARLQQALVSLGERLAEWGRSDRPSIDYVLQQSAAP